MLDVWSNVRHTIQHHGGLRGLYKGLLSGVLLNGMYRGTSIGFFDTFKFIRKDYTKVQQTSIVIAFLFSCSLCFHPLDTIRRIYMNEANKKDSKVRQIK